MSDYVDRVSITMLRESTKMNQVFSLVTLGLVLVYVLIGIKFQWQQRGCLRFFFAGSSRVNSLIFHCFPMKFSPDFDGFLWVNLFKMSFHCFL